MSASTRSLKSLAGFVAAASLLLLSGCGGGGTNSAPTTESAPPSAPAVQGTISGTAVEGPVSGATVTAYAVTDGVPGAKIVSAKTDAQGNFSLSIGAYSGAVMLQLEGGTYTDEATGTTMPMLTGDVMTAVVPAVASGATVSGIELTPLTSMAQVIAAHLGGGITDANISIASAAVGQYFMVNDILHTAPMNPLVSGSSGSATQDGIDYGMVIAAMSQLAHTEGLSSSSAIITAMMDDVSDGNFDGKMFGGTVMMGDEQPSAALPNNVATSALGNAMAAFISSGQNKSGVVAASMRALLSQLNGSSGGVTGSAASASENGIVSGTVFNGPVRQAMVTAYAITDGNRGAELSSVATDDQGGYALALAGYSGPVMLRVSAGVYTDEATGKTVTMGDSDVMAAALPAVATDTTTSGIWITPLTSIAQSLAQGMKGGLTDANITSANDGVGSYFMISDILRTAPLNPLVTGSGSGATQDGEDSGFAIAAMAQSAESLGMTGSSAFVMAMTEDASDGVLDGTMNGTQITMGGGMMGSDNMMSRVAGTSGLATAMTTFMGSSANVSGVTNTAINALIQRLATSNGQL